MAAVREARFYESLPKERVRCMACAHRCVILPGAAAKSAVTVRVMEPS